MHAVLHSDVYASCGLANSQSMSDCWGLVYLLGGIVLGDIMRPIVGGLHVFVCHDWKTRSNPYSFRVLCSYIRPEACPV